MRALLPALLFLLSLLLVLGASCAFLAAGASAGQNDPSQEPAESATPGSSPIDVENWVTPKSGWLYVLDSKPDANAPGGCIWLLDPGSGEVKGKIRTGGHADFALSPDGSTLYVASDADGDLSDLAVIDTAQGMIVERATIAQRAVADAPMPFSTMAVSGDGSTLRVLIQTPGSGDAESYLLAAFDTRAGDFLPGSVRLGNCGPGRFISYPSADQFDFLCPRTNKVRLIKVDDQSNTLRNSEVVFPWERRVGVAEALEDSGGQTIAIVRGDGAIVTMDIAKLEFDATKTGPDVPARIYPAAWPTSPDGSKLYLGYRDVYERSSDNRFYLDYGRPPNARPAGSTPKEFRVYDTRTWRKIGSIGTKMPFWSAVAGGDGRWLYAMVPRKHTILVIDTAAMRQTGTISVGGMPTLALVAP